MKTQTLILGLILCLLVPAVHTEAVSLNFVRQGCSNYGNQILVGSVSNCDAGSDCTNYGNQVFVGSAYECAGGNCPNHGIRVSVGSTVCDHGGTYACVDSYCTDGRPPNSSQAGLPGASMGDSQSFHFASASSDCIPQLSTGPAGSLYLMCDSSGQPCGINAQPVCWTTRYTCMEYVVMVLRVYDNIVAAPDKLSKCEGQPGWPPSL